MFPSKFVIRSKAIRFQLHNRPNIALFFTHITVCDEEKQEQRQQLEESITNRSYWTRKIHKLCAIDRNVDEAISLVHKLCIHGYCLDSLNLSSIIHALCDSYRFSEAHSRFLSSLSCSSGSASIIPDERTCNVIIARLLDWGKKPHVTLRVVHIIIAVKPHFVPSLTNFNRLIDQLCSCSCVHSAHILFFHMKSLGHHPNEVSYTTLINGYSRIGELGFAQKLLDEMSECDVRPNSLTYSVLIRGALHKRDIELYTSLLQKLWTTMADENHNQTVNHAAFSNLIYTLCQEGMFKSVFDIAEKMPQGNNVSNEFAYAQMIDSLCRHGRHHGASRIVYMMMKQRYVPSLLSYNSIIHGLTKNGGYLRAYQLLEQGIEFNYTPSENTYKILIECLCSQEHDLIKAKKLLDIMLNKKGVDKVRIYNIYISSLCQMKKDSSTELLNTLLIMLETKCHPDIVTLNTVINGFCKMGKLEDAIKVLDDMLIGKFSFCNPDSVTFTTIISGLLTFGRTKEAFDILYKVMPEKGFHPSVITYNVVLRGLFNLGLVNEAMDVFNSMVYGDVVADSKKVMSRSEPEPVPVVLVTDSKKVMSRHGSETVPVAASTTHAIMIDGLCKCNKVDEAKVFWDDVIWPSRVHDNFVYSAMIKGLCGSGKFDEACDFVYELVDCGVKTNVVNYNILIEGGCKLGLKKEVYQILGEMRKNEVEPDAVTWRIIDKLHKQKKNSSFEDKINV
ncbi:hypothetical protein L2E82_47326 [Cichorium intybus]|uniref:Uncharacterized protein n=1 Tax=Cichorium intybus TaxID=13427 RepID=A0ACB8YVW4_CICIN|nr:hypothetical protein L2E82_47326 [Cichorium intybus]